jgi:hypothetical protein
MTTYQITQAKYRFAENEDEIPPGHVVTFRDEPGLTTVIVRPGHATTAFLAAIEREQQAMLALGQWIRLADTDEAAANHPRRLFSAIWRLEPALPNKVICMPCEEPGRHIWLIRPGEASEELVEEMSQRLTAFVRAGIWVQRWGGHDTPLNDQGDEIG